MSDYGSSMTVVSLGITCTIMLYLIHARRGAPSLRAWCRAFDLLAASLTLHAIAMILGYAAAQMFADSLMALAAVWILRLAWRTPAFARFQAWQIWISLIVLAVSALRLLWPGLSFAYSFPPFIIALSFLCSALLFGRATADRRLPAMAVLAAACLLLGISSALAGQHAHLTAWTAATACGLLMLIAGAIAGHHEEQQISTEDHLLALSTIGFSSASGKDELREILEHVIERLLEVSGIKGGMIWVPGSERHASVRVMRGFPTGFSSMWEEREGSRKAGAVIEKMGGLLILRDLQHPASAGRLETDPDYSDFRTIFSESGAGALLALSLRTKTAVRGHMILCQPPGGFFSPAALRLLATFSTQLALGVENFTVIREASRRAEELRLLNQIGQAMSSTLNPDELLRVIHIEVKKLLDARNFYIALDDGHDGVAFELSVEDGAYVAAEKGSRRSPLIDRVEETGHPLLLRRGSPESDALLDLDTNPRPALCWLGVPIFLHDRSAGVIAVRNAERNDAYDEGHVEVLRTLAAQAAIALENSRMFVEEQRRQRHLSFLNRVARISMSNVNRDETLSEIASEIESNLEYDHVSIGVLNYETRHIELNSMGRSPVTTRSVHVDWGLIGRVVRSGEMLVRKAFEPGNQRHTLLPRAASVICLPIVHGEQTLGVLNVESLSEGGFPADEVILLQTLADQLAAALHKALVFQQVQEQAITDGLTGMKTRRFFDEALAGEWKRSLRSHRPFSVILMDLDRFKPINDRFGHVEGDMVLARIGKILEQRCRRSNVAARYGGDEFIVLMPEANSDQAGILSERLRTWIAEDPDLRERGLTASFGLATYPLHADSAAGMLKAADSALYRAKARGGNAVCLAEQKLMAPMDQVAHDLLDEIRRMAGDLVTGPEIAEALARRIERDYEQFAGQAGEMEHALTEALIALADAIARRLHGPLAHTRSPGFYAMRLSAVLGLTARDQELMRTAGSLHDLGFLAVPDSELAPRTLDMCDDDVIRTHVEAGVRLLSAARVNLEVVDAIQHHHEPFDGENSESGTGVSLFARILGVIDAFDSAAGQAPETQAGRAVEDIQKQAGTRLDPALVTAFLSLVEVPAPRSLRSSAAE